MTKSERLVLRWTREQRRIIGQAAKLRGGSQTDFIIGAAQEQAMELIDGVPAVATWQAR